MSRLRSLPRVRVPLSEVGGVPQAQVRGILGYKLPGQDRMDTPQPGQDGVSSLARTGWGTTPPLPGQNSRSTCYAAGGMPLEFRQEDYCFFLYIIILEWLPCQRYINCQFVH